MRKYSNRKVEIDGITFDSVKESRRYTELKLLERAGEIKNLHTQPRFLLQDKFKIDGKTYRKIEYVADFEYKINGKTFVEDVKSPFTRKLPVYRMKMKLLLNKFPKINFLET